MSNEYSTEKLAEAIHDVRCMAAGCHADTVPRVRSCWEWQEGRYAREAQAILAQLPTAAQSSPALLGV